jgi:putative salt-induced outer membrane protein YdiY
LVLKNGDRVTGSIVKKDDKTITIKTDAFGVISAPWDQVVSITAEKPVTVVLKNGKTVEGTMATAAGKVEVATKDAKLAVETVEVQTIRDADEQKAYERLLHPGWTQLWGWTGTLGFAGAAGNARTESFTTGFTTSRVTRNDKTVLTFSTIAASAFVDGKNSSTAKAIRGGISYDHNLSSRLFWNTFNNNEFDKFQNLDLRFIMGSGLGVHVVKADRHVLDFTAGGNYDHENFSTGLHRSSAEFFWGDDYTLQVTKGFGLLQGYRMYNNLTTTGEYRIDATVGISTRINRWLSWNTTANTHYLSDPVEGRKKNDFLYTTGLGVTFAPR